MSGIILAIPVLVLSMGVGYIIRLSPLTARFMFGILKYRDTPMKIVSEEKLSYKSIADKIG